MTEEQKEHILPLRLYAGVTAALFALTGLTVAVSYVHLGALNVIVAIGIAAIKVSLVALFFMHLKYDKKINLFVFLTAVTFVTLFIALTMIDTMRRADIYEIEKGPIKSIK